jgi:hypothetical protein
MAIWRAQFVPGAEVVAADGWRGIVQAQQCGHVVAVAVGTAPNDSLAGYRYLVADDLLSVFDPVGAALDERVRQVARDDLSTWSNAPRRSLGFPPRLSASGPPGAQTRARSLAATERPPGAGARAR